MNTFESYLFRRESPYANKSLKKTKFLPIYEFELLLLGAVNVSKISLGNRLKAVGKNISTTQNCLAFETNFERFLLSPEWFR